MFFYSFQFHPPRSGDCYFHLVTDLHDTCATFNSTPREAGIATLAQFKGAILFTDFQFHPARSGDCYKHFFDVGERRGLLSIPPRAKRGLLPFKKASVSAAPILSIPPRAKRGLLPTSRLCWTG